jgi:hypothetical protein
MEFKQNIWIIPSNKNSMEILVHRNCYQLPKNNIGAKCPYRRVEWGEVNANESGRGSTVVGRAASGQVGLVRRGERMREVGAQR